jgi:hypothetical protein
MPPPQTTEILSARVRWVAIAAGCVGGIFGMGLTLLFPIFSVPLILGAIVHPSTPRPGKWLMWVGALVLSCTGLYFSWGVMLDDLRNGLRYPDFMTVGIFYLSIATVIIVSWCDLELVVEAIRRTRTPGMTEQRSSRVGEWLVRFVAICLSLWVFPQILLDFTAYRRYLRETHLVNLVFPVLLQMAVVAFDAALIIRAVKMRQKSSSERSIV